MATNPQITQKTQIFRGPEAFRDLFAADIEQAVRRAKEKGARVSSRMRAQDGREAWMIRQAAPGLLDDRPVMRGKAAQARVEFHKLFK